MLSEGDHAPVSRASLDDGFWRKNVMDLPNLARPLSFPPQCPVGYQKILRSSREREKLGSLSPERPYRLCENEFWHGEPDESTGVADGQGEWQHHSVTFGIDHGIGIYATCAESISLKENMPYSIILSLGLLLNARNPKNISVDAVFVAPCCTK
jgi:hypothetical protein